MFFLSESSRSSGRLTFLKFALKSTSWCLSSTELDDSIIFSGVGMRLFVVLVDFAFMVSNSSVTSIAAGLPLFEFPLWVGELPGDFIGAEVLICVSG